MDVNPEHLLANYTVLRTDSIESFHAFIVGMEGPLQRRLDGTGPVEIELRRATLGRIEIGVFHANIAMTVSISRESSAAFLVQFPLVGSFNLEIDGRQVSVVPGTGAVISPLQVIERSATPGWTLVLAIPSDLLRTHLERRMGRSLTGPLTFQPLIRAGADELFKFGLLAVEAIDRGVATGRGNVALVLQNGFIDLLLELQPHNHGSDLVESEAAMRSRRVSMVADYLAEHFGETLTVEQLANVANCSVRSLQAVFAELCGMSPMEYLCRFRLALVRRWLEAGEAGVTISELACRAGFAHLGRFSASYKARYGEPPSQTQIRAKQARRAGHESPL